MSLFISTLLMLNLQSHGFSEDLSIDSQDIRVESVRNSYGTFSKVRVPGYHYTTELGSPELPVRSYLFVGTPESVNFKLEVVGQFQLEGKMPFPAQASRVRNKEIQAPTGFAFNRSAYSQRGHQGKLYDINYLGDIKGVPVTKVDVIMGRYNGQKRDMSIYTNVRVEATSEILADSTEGPQGDNKDYLIVVPKDFRDAIDEFVSWKTSIGYNVEIVELLSPELTTENVTKIISDRYNNGELDFVLLVADTVPMLRASTSDGMAQSDLRYFTMGGQDDYIPDMYFGRIPGKSSSEISSRLEKSIEYEKRVYENPKGVSRIIGIASDEGSNPSDDEYIRSIEQSFVDKYSYETTHLYQRDPLSNPRELNRHLGEGASWLFYMGHGSGTSWPSMYESYGIRDISLIKNKGDVKPIIIDVACLNGKIKDNYLGTTFSSMLSGSALGAAAYYGGTVNISWHPPALMARGIAFSHKKNNYDHLGQALLAGQMYLAKNWTSNSDIIDNFEWYILQGDPSLSIKE